jgi:peptidyl-prolyl cis-trans isomerase A (cyclophilin A)
MGDFRVQLREDLVPVTAQNFIDLTNANFYDDLIFHRVISGFMIQDGCPNGNGTGGPGYTFNDEFHPDLRHDEPGILSMANSGPNTNGSQYFITLAPTAWLNDLHSVFGKVIDGLDVVFAIGDVETNSNDKPLLDVVIDSIRVVTGEPTLNLTAPLAGFKWNGHFKNKIEWDSEFVADVKVEFSSDNGQNWTELTTSTSANKRSFELPAQNIISTECLVRVSDVAHPDIFSETESTFSLCNLELSHPDGNGFYRKGTPIEVVWESEMVDDLTLSYKTSEDGDWVMVAENIPVTDNSYLWSPEVASNWCKVQLCETAHPEAIEESNNNFIVFQLDLTSPVGGETLDGNSLANINWDYEIANAVKIEFSSDNMSTWTTIVNSVAASASPYEWEVPNINSTECFLKLTIPGLPDMYSVNETAFSIQKSIGIEDEFKTEELMIFPNPVVDELNISFSNNNKSEIIDIEIFNVKGELVLSQIERSNKIGNTIINLNTQDLAKGLYVLKIKSKTKSLSHKFVKK